MDKLVNSIKNMDFAGHFGQDVFIKYFGRHCNGIANICLLENKEYRIEILDIWEITRETVLKGVSGHLRVDMPGKECIALMAWAG